MKKYMHAIIRHEKARQAVDSITRDIGRAIGRCPVSVRAKDWSLTNAEKAEVRDEKSGKDKTHLWQAFAHREPSDCGHGMTIMGEDGIEDALARGSEFECEHCYQAYQLILQRKAARNELGRARSSIRALGRNAIKGDL